MDLVRDVQFTVATQSHKVYNKHTENVVRLTWSSRPVPHPPLFFSSKINYVDKQVNGTHAFVLIHVFPCIKTCFLNSPCCCNVVLVGVSWSDHEAFPWDGRSLFHAPSTDSAAFAWPFLFRATWSAPSVCCVVVAAGLADDATCCQSTAPWTAQPAAFHRSPTAILSTSETNLNSNS